MTAAIAADHRAAGSGLRRFDSKRDLTALANLIEVGFAENLDRSGRRMVESLRMFGRLGWLGGLLSRWLLPPAANPQGYVWEQEGLVLGNASLLPVTGIPGRWVMANVVVLPQERRKGIGRTLVTRSIEHARLRGAKEIILQVDQDNQAAIALYQTLGFKAFEPRTTWIGKPSQLSTFGVDASRVRQRRGEEWHQQWQMARTLHPEGLLWPYPPSASYFRPRAWQGGLGSRFDRHWVWVDGDRLCGSASLRWSHEPGNLRLILLVDREHQGQIEAPLIAAALNATKPLTDVIYMDYPVGVAESTLMGIGFRQLRKLIWMNLDL